MGTLPNNTPTTAVLLRPSSSPSCFRKSLRRRMCRSGSWENHSYKSLIRPQGSWNYHCGFWVSICEIVVVPTLNRSRLGGFVRMKKMGIHLTPPRQKALVDKDTSNSVLHPFFVHKILSLGMYHSVILKYSLLWSYSTRDTSKRSGRNW